MNSGEHDLPDFDGKTVVFYIEGRDTPATILSPRLDKKGGRLFVVGKAETSSGHWAEGALAAIAWDRVGSYLVFETERWEAQLQQREKARRRREQRNRKSFWPWRSGQ